jgi:ferritin-like protein
VATASAQFHEPPDELRAETRDRHRSIVSLMEELEAVDWYDQRIDATEDEELREILRHNRDEEKEHAAMLIEWLRRVDPTWHEHLTRYLFSETSFAELTAAEQGDQPRPDSRTADASLGLGSLTDKEML